MKLAIAALLCGLVCSCFAQVELTGPNQYPQFRGVSGLAGGGIPLRPENKVGGKGAVALSTPIGYALGHWKFFAGFSLLSTDGAFPPFSNSGGDLLAGNGTLFEVGSFYIKGLGHITASQMNVSGRGDNTSNYSLRIPLGNDKIGWSIGVQDVTGTIGSAGDTFPVEDRLNSQSVFTVLTYQVADGTYVSAGVGSRRFKYGFANASHWVNDRLGFFLEHDGYNFNGGACWMLGSLKMDVVGSDVIGIATVGTVRGKYPYWTIGVSF